jgi:CysZ protein
MLFSAALAAWRQIVSPPFRRILVRSVALTLICLVLLWMALTGLVGVWLEGHPLSADYPILDGFAFFLAGAGLFVALAYLMPAVSALVAGFFIDEAADIVETRDFPSDPKGQPVTLATSLVQGARFALLSLVVNIAALTVFFIPLVNVIAFFGANAYLLGREYFELAATRFHSAPEAANLRTANRGTVLLAGALLAGFVLVPVLNLATPLFGIALMVHLHKRLSARRIAP